MKILIVDDIEENLYMLESLLKGSGYEVVSAANGAEALEKIRSEGADMIISDILMPVMDGFKLCKEVRADNTLKHIPLVFYTATYKDKRDEELASKLGADRYLIKPMEPDKLLKILQDLMRDVEKGKVVPRKPVIEEKEEEVFKLYSERLVSKLEKKMLDLEGEVAERKKAEEKIKHLNLMLRTIRKVNQLIIVEKDPIRLLQGVCDNLIENRGYHCAWIAILDESGRLVNSAETGLGKEFQPLAERLKSGDLPYCGRKTMSKSGVVVIKDPFSSCTDCPLSEKFHDAKAMSIRLEYEEKVYGLLVVSFPAELVTDEEEQSLFHEVAGDISFALHDIELEEERNRAEDEIKRLAKFPDENPNPVLRVAKDGTILYANKAALHCLNVWKCQVNQPLPDHLREFVFDVISSGLSKVIEVECEDCIFSLTFVPVVDAGYINLYGLDITERKLAEEKIKEYSENLEGMVEERTSELNRALYDTEAARDKIDGILKSVSDGLIVTDIYNRILLMNSAAEDLLSIRFSEVIDRPIDFAIDESSLREKLIDTLGKKETGYQFDFELPGDDPKYPRFMRAGTSVIHDREGKDTGIITIFHDVTHEREVDRMKTEFLSTAAHELRTPLTSIQGFSEILQTREDISEEEKKRFLSYINKQAVNLAEIVNDLLDISRIESGRKYTINKEICDAGECIKNTISYFQEISSKHKFEVVLPDKPVKLYIDKDKMEQVLKNLLSNAVKYSSEGGVIRVAGEAFEDYYQVSVEDQGMGMTPEQVEKVFDKFYRADASNTAVTGTGLGMSIVKYFVEAHGGKVFVESDLGKGTTVRFTIPLDNKRNEKNEEESNPNNS